MVQAEGLQLSRFCGWVSVYRCPSDHAFPRGMTGQAPGTYTLPQKLPGSRAHLRQLRPHQLVVLREPCDFSFVAPGVSVRPVCRLLRLLRQLAGQLSHL